MTALSLPTAQTIIAGALSHARSKGLKPMAIIALDARGSLIAAATEDGNALGRWKIALGKAYGALFFGVGSKKLGAMALERPHFMAAAAHLAADGMIPVAGGALIRDREGQVIGAVGASGDTSDNDEAAATAGIVAAGLTADGG